MRTRIVALVAAAALLLFAYVMPGVRRQFMQKVITWDAEPSEPIALKPGIGLGMTLAPRVRVILIDGLAESTAATLPNWSALCKRGIALTEEREQALEDLAAWPSRSLTPGATLPTSP